MIFPPFMSWSSTICAEESGSETLFKPPFLHVLGYSVFVGCIFACLNIKSSLSVSLSASTWQIYQRGLMENTLWWTFSTMSAWQGRCLSSRALTAIRCPDSSVEISILDSLVPTWRCPFAGVFSFWTAILCMVGLNPILVALECIG